MSMNGLGNNKPYPAYKNSGVDWLGEVPTHWNVERLKYAAPITVKRFDGDGDNTVYVALEHIEPWTGKLLSDATPAEVESNTTYFRVGDVLFGKLRPYLAKVLHADTDGHCSTELVVIRSNETIKSNYLAYQLRSADYINWLNAMTYGTKMPRANPDQIGNSVIAFPPLPEQQAIGRFLDQKTSEIDNLIAAKERLITLLQEKRAALITTAVTKGLDPAVPMKDSGVEWLGRVPAHWETGSLSRWWQVIDCKHRTVKFEDLGLPVASIGEVQGLEVDLSSAKRTSNDEYQQMIEGDRDPRYGDILYSRNATVGSAAMVTTIEKFCMGQDVSLIRSSEQVPRYLLFLLHSSTLQGQLDSLLVGSTFKRINVGKIKGFTVPLPPVPEQHEIGVYCQRQHDDIQRLIDLISNGIERLQEYRTALISAAVTGKIDVRDYEV